VNAPPVAVSAPPVYPGDPASAGPSSAASGGQSAAGASAGTNGASSLAASPSTVPASPASKLAGKVVVIDPGHDGGNETHISEINKLVPQGFGAEKACDTTGTNGDDGYPEHAFTFQVSLLVRSLLEDKGIKVILTRGNDSSVGPCVNVRAAIGNNAGADAAISIHADGGPSTGRGFQLLEADKSVGGSSVDKASRRLAVDLHASFVSESGLIPSDYVGTNGYEPRDDLAGLNLSSVPKIMAECGNMRNGSDLALQESSSGRAKMAKAIADGIIKFLSS
jgi:N-acetylmuramoyl-L-alanine amidase